jgi:hypothetical protein
MHAHLIPILLLALPLASCEKAKILAEKATSTVKEQIAAKTGGGKDSKVDPELRKLVDQTPEGVIFRKDLPFPTRIEIKTTRCEEWTGRFYQTSAIEHRAEPIKGTRLTVTKLERAGDEVRHTLEQTGFTVPSPDDPAGEKQTQADPLAAIAPSNHSNTFRKSGETWTADASGGFRSAALAKELSPVLGQLLIETALAPRSLWFSGKKRFKQGDQVVVTGDLLPMLLAGEATGTLNLKLESFEPVDGHPCGVFLVSGDFRRKQFPDFAGTFTDEDVTIQSGKLWLSLIHPVILREELDTIQTVRYGTPGGQNSRSQGSIKVSVKRQWKALGS